MRPKNIFQERNNFGSGRRIEIKNHIEGRDDNVLQISLVRCNSVNHEKLSQQIFEYVDL